MSGHFRGKSSHEKIRCGRDLAERGAGLSGRCEECGGRRDREVRSELSGKAAHGVATTSKGGDTHPDAAAADPGSDRASSTRRREEEAISGYFDPESKERCSGMPEGSEDPES